FAFQHIDDQSALVAVLAGMGMNVVDEYVPIAQHAISVVCLSDDVELEPSLAGLLPRQLLAFKDHRTGGGPVPQLHEVLQGPLVTVVHAGFSLACSRPL